MFLVDISLVTELQTPQLPLMIVSCHVRFANSPDDAKLIKCNLMVVR